MIVKKFSAMLETMKAGNCVAWKSLYKCKAVWSEGEGHPNQQYPGLSAGSAITSVSDGVNDSDSQPENVGISYNSFPLEPCYKTPHPKLLLTEHADDKYNIKHGCVGETCLAFNMLTCMRYHSNVVTL